MNCARSSVWRVTCSITNDWVIRHEGRWLQLHPGSRRYGPTKSKALVCEYEDGPVEVYHRGARIGFHEIAERVQEVAEPEMRVAMGTPLAAPPFVPRPSASL